MQDQLFPLRQSPKRVYTLFAVHGPDINAACPAEHIRLTPPLLPE